MCHNNPNMWYLMCYNNLDIWYNNRDVIPRQDRMLQPMRAPIAPTCKWVTTYKLWLTWVTTYKLWLTWVTTYELWLTWVTTYELWLTWVTTYKLFGLSAGGDLQCRGHRTRRRWDNRSSCGLRHIEVEHQTVANTMAESGHTTHGRHSIYH